MLQHLAGRREPSQQINQPTHNDCHPAWCSESSSIFLALTAEDDDNRKPTNDTKNLLAPPPKWPNSMPITRITVELKVWLTFDAVMEIRHLRVQEKV
ncbi:unnamed protein product [Tuber aestivum]|uniref:Uncharacterized protein n=1 Tax=Tuber aestivum TaxID=59557 RepID=A0A292Q1D5_9PEZI|nr:unnamed protein product [Tuber aestivum]